MKPEDRPCQLLGYTEWADACIWSVVAGDRTRLFDDVVRDKLRHLHVVQDVYATLWRGEDVSVPEEGNEVTFSSLLGYGKRAHREMRLAIERIDDGDRNLAIPWAEELVDRIGGSPAPVSVIESIEQIAIHSGHHRGQITMHLAARGASLPLVDYVAWLWMGRPKPDWP